MWRCFNHKNICTWIILAHVLFLTKRKMSNLAIFKKNLQLCNDPSTTEGRIASKKLRIELREFSGGQWLGLLALIAERAGSVWPEKKQNKTKPQINILRKKCYFICSISEQDFQRFALWPKLEFWRPSFHGSQKAKLKPFINIYREPAKYITPGSVQCTLCME